MNFVALLTTTFVAVNVASAAVRSGTATIDVLNTECTGYMPDPNTCYSSCAAYVFRRPYIPPPLPTDGHYFEPPLMETYEELKRAVRNKLASFFGFFQSIAPSENKVEWERAVTIKNKELTQARVAALREELAIMPFPCVSSHDLTIIDRSIKISFGTPADSSSTEVASLKATLTAVEASEVEPVSFPWDEFIWFISCILGFCVFVNNTSIRRFVIVGGKLLKVLRLVSALKYLLPFAKRCLHKPHFSPIFVKDLNGYTRIDSPMSQKFNDSSTIAMLSESSTLGKCKAVGNTIVTPGTSPNLKHTKVTTITPMPKPFDESTPYKLATTKSTEKPMLVPFSKEAVYDWSLTEFNETVAAIRCFTTKKNRRYLMNIGILTEEFIAANKIQREIQVADAAFAAVRKHGAQKLTVNAGVPVKKMHPGLKLTFAPPRKAAEKKLNNQADPGE